MCGKPALAAHRPFCSPRCRDVDLHRWLSGSYAIPARDTDEDSGASSPNPRDDPRDDIPE